MMAAVELNGVVKRFGTFEAVAGVSLNVHAGERLALLGHNGAGKTTLMKLMLGLIGPSAGELRVLGERPGDVTSPARLGIGFLPEAVAFHQTMTGTELIRFYARLKRRPHEEADALLESVGLAHAASRRVATYSKGMRQRLGLAQALLGSPRLLLLDEPTTGLDPELRQAFYEIVRARAEAGAAVILSSHLLTELEERTDRIVIMDHGRVVAEGTLAQLEEMSGLGVTLMIQCEPGAQSALQAAMAPWRARIEGETITAHVPSPDKLKAMRAALALEGVRDIQAVSPGLDALYAHFLTQAAEAKSCPPS